MQETNRAPQTLPENTSLVQLYDRVDGSLLLLGTPGSGKTTLLLGLTRSLLDRAQANDDLPVPVVFNLSSWAQKRPPRLEKWLVEELETKYHLSSKLGMSLLATRQLIPLLDGLDEVAENARSACVQAINTYHQECLLKGPAPLVICCRSEEYRALTNRVSFRQAISIQPLTDEQIEQYLQSTRGQLEGLRMAFRHDQGFYTLAHQPLMLSIFTLAYQGAELKDFPLNVSREILQRQAFATYFERMLTRRGKTRYSREQIQRWLAFLATQMDRHDQTEFYATQMDRHDQTEFYLEYMQPDWLTTQTRQLFYRWIAGCFTAVISVLASLLMSILILEIVFVFPNATSGQFGHGLLANVEAGLYFGLIGGLSGGIIGGVIVGIGKIHLRERFT